MQEIIVQVLALLRGAWRYRWLAVALTLGSGPAEGDRVVPKSGRGIAVLVAGAAAAAADGALTSAGGSSRKNGATPEGHLRR